MAHKVIAATVLTLFSSLASIPLIDYAFCLTAKSVSQISIDKFPTAKAQKRINKGFCILNARIITKQYYLFRTFSDTGVCLWFTLRFILFE